MGKAGAVAVKTVVVLLMVVMLTACARVPGVTPESTATPRPTPESTATPRPTPEPTATPRPTPEPTATPLPITKEAAEHYDIGQKLFNSENYEAAVPHLKIAAEGGHPDGWRMYGWCLLYGKGTKKKAGEGYNI